MGLTLCAWKKQNFNMEATLLWTISDFPAYEMLSSWSTHGKLTCLYCMEHEKSFMLKHSSKCCWFDRHHQYLSPEHSFRHDPYSFKNSTIERWLPPQWLNVIEIMCSVSQLEDFIFGLTSSKKKKNKMALGKFRIGWRRAYFLVLPYWSTNLPKMWYASNIFYSLTFCLLCCLLVIFYNFAYDDHYFFFFFYNILSFWQRDSIKTQFFS